MGHFTFGGVERGGGLWWRSPKRPATPVAASLAASLIVALLSSTPIRAQNPETLTATIQPEPGEWLEPTDAIRIELSRPLETSEGRLAVVIGTTDWTGLARASSSSLEIRPASIKLPRGRHDLVLYVVAPGNVWREVATFAIAVLTESGFEQADVRPSVELGLAGQPARGQRPIAPPDPRDTFHDVTLRGGWQTTHVRGGWTTSSALNMVGVSYRPEALRFGERGEAAPLVDLADYQVGVENGKVALSLGHGAWGTHRQLVNAFGSRGATSLVKLGQGVDLSLAALNGSSVVGFANPFGLADTSHRILGGTVGVEAVPARPGALRLAASVLDGSVLPIAGFNQGAVQDAERSRGLGFQVVAADPAGRFSLDSGFARSRFTNPADPGFGLDVIDVQETTRNARYLDASYAVVHGAPIGGTTQANLIATFRHSRVDPLYRSVTLPITSDLEEHAVGATAAIGAVTSQVSYQRSRDNLDEIPSILTTRTRMLSWTSSLPLSGLAGASPRAAAFPTVSYGLSRTHQAGDGLPVNGLFDSLSQVPDQLSAMHTFGVAWQMALWRAGYTLNRSLQDNRQVGRERADLANLVHAIQAGVSPSSRFDANVDVAFEGADNRELVTTDLTRRISVSATGRPAARTSLGGSITLAFLRSDPSPSQRRTTDFNLQLSQSVAFWPRRPDALQGQAFVRFARQTIWTFALPGASPADEQIWTFNTGVTFKVF